MEDWSDKTGMEFGKRMEELEMEKGGVDEALEKLIKKVKEKIRFKRRRRGKGV